MPTDRPLLVHCGSGARAAVAAAYLSRTARKIVLANDLFANYRKVGEVVKG